MTMTLPINQMIDCPLLRTVQGTATDYWNDSCAVDELAYAIERGAVGATSNPTIVLEVMHKEKAHWTERVRDLRREHPTWTEIELTWATDRGDGRQGCRDPARPSSSGKVDGPAVCRSRQIRPSTRIRPAWSSRASGSHRSRRTSR